jgi:hypothetical protein
VRLAHEGAHSDGTRRRAAEVPARRAMREERSSTTFM